MLFLILLASAAGILIYTGLLFLIISIRKSDRSTYLMFALCSFFFGIHLIFKIITIHQETIPKIFIFFRPQVACEFLAAIFLVWMVAYYTQVKPRRFLWLITSISLLMVILNLVLPYGTIWAEISGLKPINLPWGESWVHPIGTPHPLIILGSVNEIFGFGFFFFFACWRQYQRGERQKASVLAFSLGIFLTSIIHIYLVDAGFLSGFMSTQPFAFLLMIILISLQLVNNIVTNERQLKYYSNNLEQLVESRTQELKVAIQKTTRLEERNRLAGELHDSVNQNLHSLVMIADSLPKLWQTRPEEILPALRKMNDIAQETLAKMRDMLVELYPQKLTEKPLGELLREMSQAIAHRTSLQVTTCIGSHSNLSPEVQICFYRIAQEAINNILRHARARQIEIHLNCQHLQCKSERLQLLIKDDGIGFSDKDVLPESLGFRLMADRVKNIGGYLKISSQPGQGTEVLIESPVVT